jgi:hypothetical protein
MKRCYVHKQFGLVALKVIDDANSIIEEYTQKGFTLTLRQLYYQFVSRDLLPNTQQNYKRLGSVINDARLAGLIDWEALEDRTRNLEKLAVWDNPAEIVHACARQFRTDWWQKQPYYIEAWIEKDALIGVLEAACTPLQIPYLSCRGYTSASEMWRASQRIGQAIDAGRTALILHLGDHDPSGIDMSRDITERIRLFLSGDGRDPDRFELSRLALSMDQVETYNPPPNPAKTTDTRYAAYQQVYGEESWELDALDPEVIRDLINDTVNPLLNQNQLKTAKTRQQSGRLQLSKAAIAWDEIVEALP